MVNSTPEEHSKIIRTEIIRTERGLNISGTRITLYDVMDYVTAQYPPKFIQGLFRLTEPQIKAAIDYIQAHRSAVEAEYQWVIKETEELRQCFGSVWRDRIAQKHEVFSFMANQNMKGKCSIAKVTREEQTFWSFLVITVSSVNKFSTV